MTYSGDRADMQSCGVLITGCGLFFLLVLIAAIVGAVTYGFVGSVVAAFVVAVILVIAVGVLIAWAAAS